MAVQIASILTWAKHFAARGLSPKNPEILEHTFQVKPELNEKVSIWQGDITTIEGDAIVNAANPSLLGGGGVDGAIHLAAGDKLLDECAKLNGCKVGEAKLTKGYNLPAKHIIHTVGTMTQNPIELADSYKNSLALMLQNSFRSIVFPCISTGVYGYDPENAAHTALYETRMFLNDHHSKVDRIIFCVYSDADLKIYEELMQRYFPVVEPPSASLSLEEAEMQIKRCPEEMAKYGGSMKKSNFVEIFNWELLSKV